MRLASLTPSNTEVLAFLGKLDSLVARDDFSDWPPEVEEVTNVGPDLQIDVDELADLDPDLVLAARSVPGMEAVNERLAEADLPHLVLAPHSLADIRKDVLQVADELGVPERGRELAAAMAEGIEAIETALAGVEPVDVYWEWWPNPAYTPGNEGWTDEVIAKADGRNVFADESTQSLAVELAEVQAADPDVVALCWQGTLHPKQSRQRFREREEGAWGELRAARDDRILLMPEELYGRPGPRIVEGIRRLAAELHPDRRQALPEPYAWLPDGLKGKLPLRGSMSRIATGTGDEGETSLFGGERVAKDHPAVEAYGTVDELNAVLGLVQAATEDAEQIQTLERRQRELFAIGAELATPGSSDTRIGEERVERLEAAIDELEEKLPQLQTFVLPTGSEQAARLHQARAVCRRAERRTIALHNSEAGPVRETVRVYLNRLSDLLFLEAREAAIKEGTELEVDFGEFQEE